MHIIRLSTVAILCGLFSQQAQSAPSDYVAPVLRYENYLAIRAEPGMVLHCQITPAPSKNRVYQDWLKVRLLRPDGQSPASAAVSPTEPAQLSARVDWHGICALESLSGSTLVQVAIPEDTPHAYHSTVEKPLITVGAWGPLYFHVPPDTSEFTIWLRASVTGEGLCYTIRDSHGKTVRTDQGDFDDRTEIKIPVPDGQDDTTWSLQLSQPPRKGLYLDDVSVELGPQLPPFLSPRPEWSASFFRTAASKVASTKLPRRSPDTPPTAKPFRGISNERIDRALSRDVTRQWKTTLPFTYILDYGKSHLGNDNYVPTVATAPPTLLHLGKDVPFTHGWGPIKALGGENQAYGTGDYITRINPEEVAERIAGLRNMTRDLRANGVRWVMPYICAMTLNGDSERRTGFWDFYDHWDAYRTLGLCPKPQADPMQWLQQYPDGRPYQYYKYDYPAQYYPAFKTNHRFAACWRSEGWRTWLCEVVRFVAKCGYDGAFVDNGRSQRCHCPRCLNAFQKYLEQQYSPKQAEELFGITSFADVKFPERGDTLLEAERNRFWCNTTREQLATLKSVGTEELGREFIVFPNGGDPKAIQRSLPDTDFVMFEKSHGDYGTHPGQVTAPLFQGVTLRAYNNNIFEYKFVQCLRQRVKPIILSRAGYPRSPPERFLNPNAARLGMAECGAFSGGGAFLLRPYFGIYHDALNEYRRFFETHPQLYAGLETYAPVAVLACPEQQWFGNPTHLNAVRLLTERLTSAHVLFDYISEFRLQEDVLKKYPSIIATDLRVVSHDHLAALESYVKHGGHLIVVGQFAAQDETLKSRSNVDNPFLTLTRESPHNPAPLGRGRVTTLAQIETVPTSLGEAASVLTCPDEVLGAQVKTNAFRSLAQTPARIVVHLVNYNVPLGVDAAPPVPVHNIQLKLPLPPDHRAVSAKFFTPTHNTPRQLPINHSQNRVHITIPQLNIYGVTEIILE